MRRLIVLAVVMAGLMVTASAASARVLLVGSYHGIRGQYGSIQAAVDAAKQGDWILVGPGDYKTTSSRAPKGFADRPAGVLITKANLKLRGMNRNAVVVDGTRPGSAQCSRSTAAQNFGPGPKNAKLGLNGIMIWKADKVTVQNLTVCNFLGGKGHVGNEIWWNGGDGSGKIGGWGYTGSYLNATSTFFSTEATAATYGIFSSNWNGGTWDQTYASNFNDSDYYIGACRQECNQVVSHAWAQYSVLGYSGTNAGGTLVVKNSEFDHNKDGFDTNSQNADFPSPQNGACPNNGISPITHTHSCWVFMNNYVHDNNNPNVPSAGAASAGPVGTGMSISGGRNDTVMNNRFVNNKAWGVIFVPYIDNGGPCTGGILNLLGSGTCLFDDSGLALMNNTFSGNGSFGNLTNGDFQTLTFTSGNPNNCFAGNKRLGGAAVQPASAAALQVSNPTCTSAPASKNIDTTFLAEVLCNSGVTGVLPHPCTATDKYPRRQRVIMPPLPTGKLKTMPNPCRGVPRNPWCPANRP